MQIVDVSSVELLDIPEVAAKLRVSPKTVARLCKSGVLESVKIGTRRLVPPQAVADYIGKLRAGQVTSPEPDVA